MDQINLERLGVPTVSVITNPFTSLGKTVGLAEAGVEICSVVEPHPMGMIQPEEVRKKAEDAFPEVFKAATSWQPAPKPAAVVSVYPAERVSFSGSIDEVNRLFFEKGWSMGLPIIPPTEDRVARMLKGTLRSPGEVLGQVPPRMGSLTVELAAASAVMAGCRPEYMPLLIAALEALLVPDANWRGSLATTGTTQTLVVVNGPVAREIGLATGQGAAGKGNQANGSIGYAINLIGYVVGGSKPPSIDKSTLGSPADYVCWVFGENEAELPAGWPPMHVDLGFARRESVVTVMNCYQVPENIDHWSVTPQEHVRYWSNVISPLHNVGGPSHPLVMEQRPIIGFGPEHAQLLASAGWSKDDFKKALWEQARIPLSAWPDACNHPRQLDGLTGPLTPETMIPIVSKPGLFLIVMAGGAGKHSHYFPPFPGCYPISKIVGK